MQSYALIGLLAASSALALPNRAPHNAYSRTFMPNMTQPPTNVTIPSNSSMSSHHGQHNQTEHAVVPFIPGTFNGGSMPFNCSAPSNCTESMNHTRMGVPQPPTDGFSPNNTGSEANGYYPVGFMNPSAGAPVDIPVDVPMESPNSLLGPANQTMSRRGASVAGSQYQHRRDFTDPYYNGTNSTSDSGSQYGYGSNLTEPYYNSTEPYYNSTEPYYNSTEPYYNSTEPYYNGTNNTAQPMPNERSVFITDLFERAWQGEKRSPQATSEKVVPGVNGPDLSLGSTSSGNTVGLNGLTVSQRRQVEQIAREMLAEFARTVGVTSLDADGNALYAGMSPSEIDTVSNVNTGGMEQGVPLLENPASRSSGTQQ
ncbi:hypothetical protein CALCODRAFT_507828 [Calocera cornea HHB12733]|uniref:Uncharacterized protein n=1 Tax=Calocera cornea HHB12733 TaxID=1353952 RepID=A0A165H979_9BASI|nr:hypothetical protein CALCODRAFT_507828 [Calocera cornea HHB12733]